MTQRPRSGRAPRTAADARRLERRARALALRRRRRRRAGLVVLAVMLWAGCAGSAVMAWRIAHERESIVGGTPLGTPIVERAIAPRGAGALSQPTGVAVSGDRVYVADSRLGYVAVFDRDGSRVATLGAGELATPVYVAVGPVDGRIYVVDRGRNEVVVFGADGTRLRAMDPRGSEPASGAPRTWRPLALGFAPDGSMFVADVSGDQSIVGFSPTGVRTVRIGDGIEPGPTGHRLAFPNGIAASEDELVVTDSNNSRLIFMSLDGTVRRIVQAGGLPRGAAALADGRIVAIDAALHAIRVFSSTGVELQQAGGYGRGPGQFAFPAGVAVDRDGRVYVADTGNARISVVRIPAPKPAVATQRAVFWPWAVAGVTLALMAGALSVSIYMARRSAPSRVAAPERL